MKRVMVDMSATLIHHGHIRLLKYAKQFGHIVVALTSDNEILKHKGYFPELEFDHRYEILYSIEYVDEIIESPWMITHEFLIDHNIDFLIHGHDNSNEVPPEKIKIIKRTEGISSSLIRERIIQNYILKKGK